MRLIDADALMKELEREVELADDWKTAHEITNVVKYFPTIEPQRMRGKWTKDNACEFCGFQPWYERNINTLSFCPNCGADMRGGHGESN